MSTPTSDKPPASVIVYSVQSERNDPDALRPWLLQKGFGRVATVEEPAQKRSLALHHRAVWPGVIARARGGKAAIAVPDRGHLSTTTSRLWLPGFMEQLRLEGVRLLIHEGEVDSEHPTTRFWLSMIVTPNATRPRRHARGAVPYGYREVDGLGYFVRNEDEQLVIARMSQLFLDEGYTLARIGNVLAHEGLHPRRGESWAPKTVRDILMRELGDVYTSALLARRGPRGRGA